MSRWILAAAALVALSSPAKAVELDASTLADVRCVVAISIDASQASPDQVKSLAIMTFYFIGRIEGRNAKFDFGAAFASEAKKMSHAEYASRSKSCLQQFQKRASELDSTAKAL